MDRKPKIMCDSSSFNHLVPSVWSDSRYGIRKEVISFNFKSMNKASECSKCLVCIDAVENLNGRPTSYLVKQLNTEQWIEMNTAVTPIDYLVELIVRNMFCGETSKCAIQTKSGIEIKFTITLLDDDCGPYLFELTAKELFDWAKKCKENGVVMFKEYSSFAQTYFNKAAKALISFKPFSGLR